MEHSVYHFIVGGELVEAVSVWDYDQLEAERTFWEMGYDINKGKVVLDHSEWVD